MLVFNIYIYILKLLPTFTKISYTQEKKKILFIEYKMDWSSQLPFSAFVRFLERMVNTKKSGRFKCLQSFLDECRKLVPVDGSLFPVMRLLGPSLDKERGSYKMKVN